MLSIGLMSGTSMDGIDAALLETDGSAQLIKDLGHISIPYAAQSKVLFKAAEFAVRHYLGNLDETRKYFYQSLQNYLEKELGFSKDQTQAKIAELSHYLQKDQTSSEVFTLDDIIQHSTELHYQAVMALLKASKHSVQQIDVIGYHGQTLFHRPSLKVSIVVGNGQWLANSLNITVVNDFRSRDVAAGGQGAPFAPLYHLALALGQEKMPVAVVNCGGIANISLITTENELELMGFDTGPGNGLIDRLVRQRTQGRENMDKDGHYGEKGRIDADVLKALYAKSLIIEGKNYFEKLPPKALDIGDMILIPELDKLSLNDACATLEAFTADSIINSLKLLNIKSPRYWILAGGGWHNPVIKRELTERLSQQSRTIKVMTADEAGWNSQAMEAQIFAYLAVRSLQNKPLSVPGTTRVPMPLSGGHAYLPASGPTDAVNILIQNNRAVLSGYLGI